MQTLRNALEDVILLLALVLVVAAATKAADTKGNQPDRGAAREIAEPDPLSLNPIVKFIDGKPCVLLAIKYADGSTGGWSGECDDHWETIMQHLGKKMDEAQKKHDTLKKGAGHVSKPNP